MADIELVIKIPNSLYANLKKIKHGSIASARLLQIMKNGTPLPKEHGRLIDADAYLANTPIRESAVDTWIKEVYVYMTIMDTPTIIEADKE